MTRHPTAESDTSRVNRRRSESQVTFLKSIFRCGSDGVSVRLHAPSFCVWNGRGAGFLIGVWNGGGELPFRVNEVQRTSSSGFLNCVAATQCPQQYEKEDEFCCSECSGSQGPVSCPLGS